MSSCFSDPCGISATLKRGRGRGVGDCASLNRPYQAAKVQLGRHGARPSGGTLENSGRGFQSLEPRGPEPYLEPVKGSLWVPIRITIRDL